MTEQQVLRRLEGMSLHTKAPHKILHLLKREAQVKNPEHSFDHLGEMDGGTTDGEKDLGGNEHVETDRCSKEGKT